MLYYYIVYKMICRIHSNHDYMSQTTTGNIALPVIDKSQSQALLFAYIVISNLYDGKTAVIWPNWGKIGAQSQTITQKLTIYRIQQTFEHPKTA